MDDEEIGNAIVKFFIAALIGLFVYAWLVLARLPTIVAGPIGLILLLVALAALFEDVGDVVSDAINAIKDLVEDILQF